MLVKSPSPEPVHKSPTPEPEPVKKTPTPEPEPEVTEPKGEISSHEFYHFIFNFSIICLLAYDKSFQKRFLLICYFKI